MGIEASALVGAQRSADAAVEASHSRFCLRTGAASGARREEPKPSEFKRCLPQAGKTHCDRGILTPSRGVFTDVSPSIVNILQQARGESVCIFVVPGRFYGFATASAAFFREPANRAAGFRTWGSDTPGLVRSEPSGVFVGNASAGAKNLFWSDIAGYIADDIGSRASYCSSFLRRTGDSAGRSGYDKFLGCRRQNSRRRCASGRSG